MDITDFSEIDFVSEREKELFLEARLGSDVELFLKGDVGRMLHTRAALQLEEVKEEMYLLSTSSVFFKRKFKKLQERGRLAELFMKWCADAIVTGHQAAISIEKESENL